jgi:hypothetical protein
MSKRKKQQQKPEMTLGQKFNIAIAVCIILTAVATCILLAVFF